MSTFQALMLDQEAGKVTPTIKPLSEDDLPEGDVLVRVEYSTLNYKDGLVLNGLGRLVRNYPHVPGIDFAGVVEDSSSDKFKPGDKVILTGWRVGELHWGGYAQKARVKADWLVPLPDGLSTKQAMAIGTAGFTAMLAIMALEKHGLTPGGDGEVLVTGAGGGLGSIAVAVLNKLGHKVAAVTGRESLHPYLKELGASTIVDRAEFAEGPAKPLLSERWSGAVDAVGGPTLAAVVAGLRYRASVAACGNAGGIEMKGTVLPFILRGVNLLGIDSVMSPMEERSEAWRRLAQDLPLDMLDRATTVKPLRDLPELGARILKGGVQGRTVIDVNA